ncbi:MAG: 2,5-diamino-6-(ribosylamino)-4(3H)-pyrimidinone 5'-phosphate reductase [Methanobacteriota archaeon]|uniref:2,5-diamino-6-(ribosylamino)-4(3H)-pyrimidinone 5'-phosphate reductase n=1 Tax=Halorutilus salinus TaxID=2487751 RepID=A0A9Q4C3V9_9EURY|nr:2,5-diamino-6-(ribosylamino)-4(3H)-pyrimidinone 5'-phosphate reductase [Halorutilus salinus]
MYVVVNAGMSADGKLSDRTRSQVALSCEDDFERVDRLRAETDAILVGVGTVLADDPSLTVKDDRLRAEEGNPVRVVLDSSARTPVDASVLDGEAETVVAVTDETSGDSLDAPRERTTVVELPGDDGRVDLHALLDELSRRGVEHLMVEGGGETIASFLSAGVVDEVRVYVAPVFVGGRESPTLVDGEGFVEYVEATVNEVKPLGEGVVLRYIIE